MTVSERIPFSGLLLPLQEGYTYSCDCRTTDGMELLFIRIFAVKGGFESGEALVATVIENKLMVSTLKDE